MAAKIVALLMVVCAVQAAQLEVQVEEAKAPSSWFSNIRDKVGAHIPQNVQGYISKGAKLYSKAKGALPIAAHAAKDQILKNPHSLECVRASQDDLDMLVSNADLVLQYRIPQIFAEQPENLAPFQANIEGKGEHAKEILHTALGRVKTSLADGKLFEAGVILTKARLNVDKTMKEMVADSESINEEFPHVAQAIEDLDKEFFDVTYNSINVILKNIADCIRHGASH